MMSNKQPLSQYQCPHPLFPSREISRAHPRTLRTHRSFVWEWNPCCRRSRGRWGKQVWSTKKSSIWFGCHQSEVLLFPLSSHRQFLAPFDWSGPSFAEELRRSHSPQTSSLTPAYRSRLSNVEPWAVSPLLSLGTIDGLIRNYYPTEQRTNFCVELLEIGHDAVDVWSLTSLA